MAILDIVTYPEKSLSEPSAPIDQINEEVRQLIADMGETMFQEAGVGLAAPQVGKNLRLIVYDPAAADPDLDPEAKAVTALINPEIIDKSEAIIISENEGCLSVLDYRADVKRHEAVTVRALDIEGKPLEFKADGLLAIIMQHEIDHLDGILFIDRLDAESRMELLKKVEEVTSQ